MPALDDDYNGIAKRTGWCKKQTSAETKKGLKWKEASLVKRFFISDGYRVWTNECPAMRAALCLHSVLHHAVQVDYYDKAPADKTTGKSKDGSKAKSRGVFDLREVESLSTTTDPTAPEWCVMVQVEKHRFVLDFGYKGERNAWLRIWCNAVPSLAISTEWQAEFVDEEMKKEIATRGPFGQIGSRGSIFGNGAIVRRLSRTASSVGATLSRSNSSMKNAKAAEPDAAAAAAAAAAAGAAPEAEAKKSKAEAERAKLLEEAAEKEKAAVKMQCMLRGKKARSAVAEKRKAALTSAEAASAEAERVKLLERAAADAEAEAKQLEEAAETADAATKMQAALRGKSARKKAKEARDAADQQGDKAKAAEAKANADAAVIRTLPLPLPLTLTLTLTLPLTLTLTLPLTLTLTPTLTLPRTPNPNPNPNQALLAAEEAEDEVKAEVARAAKLEAQAEVVKREAATIKMQATIRGRNARKAVDKKKQELTAAKAAVEAAKSKTAATDAAAQAAADELLEAEQAATKMQSSIRGSAARKKVEEAKANKAKADAAMEAARREQEDKEKVAATKAAEAKAAEAEAAQAAMDQNKLEREADGMVQRQKEQAAATVMSSTVRGRSTRKSLKEQAAATKLAVAQAAQAQSYAAAAAKEVAAAHAELKKRGSSRVLEENLAEAEEKQGQLAALGGAKACIAKAEQARLDAMKAAETPDGEAPFDLYGTLMVTLCKCFAPPPPMDPVQAAEEANLINSQGLQFNARGDSRAALRCFNKAASLCPLQSRYLLSAGNMHVKLREAQAARCIYEWLLTLPLADKEASVAQSKLEEAIAMETE